MYSSWIARVFKQICDVHCFWKIFQLYIQLWIIRGMKISKVSWFNLSQSRLRCFLYMFLLVFLFDWTRVEALIPIQILSSWFYSRYIGFFCCRTNVWFINSRQYLRLVFWPISWYLDHLRVVFWPENGILTWGWYFDQINDGILIKYRQIKII